VINAYKKLWGWRPRFEPTVSREDFSKALLLHIAFCVALSLMPSKFPLMTYTIISCKGLLCFCSDRLKDSGHNPYWLFLSLTGTGLLYVLYLLLLVPTLTLGNGNSYKEIEIILEETDRKTLVLFEFLEKIRYNNHDYLFLSEPNKEPEEVIILRVDDNETFTSVDTSTSDELFSMFKEQTNYEFV